MKLLYFTHHVRDRMKSRGISKKDVEADVLILVSYREELK